MSNIKLFNDKKIRAQWDAEREDWWFSVVDVVAVLTDSENPTDYLKKMRKRDTLLGEYIGTNCPQVEMLTETGKQRKMLAADTKQLLRIIQSIPSPNAEPFKIWLAQVGNERIEEIYDPEKAINRALDFYRKKGYTEEWINQRLKTINMRKELTDEWKRSGVSKGMEYAILTDEMTKAWSDMTTREYKAFKSLSKENLRDNMSNLELALNMLAEVATKEISEGQNPATFEQSKAIAKEGGTIAKVARTQIETKSGKPAITEKNSYDNKFLLSNEKDKDDQR